jgi:hypothetical protein
MLRGSVLRTGDGEEVEIENIVTGETILMTGLEGAARTLLTHGPVAEVMAVLENLQVDPKVSEPPKSVHILPRTPKYWLMHLYSP